MPDDPYTYQKLRELPLTTLINLKIWSQDLIAQHMNSAQKRMGEWRKITPMKDERRS